MLLAQLCVAILAITVRETRLTGSHCKKSYTQCNTECYTNNTTPITATFAPRRVVVHREDDPPPAVPRGRGELQLCKTPE